MNKKLLTLLIIVGIAFIFVATGIQAGTEVSDVITMESKVYKKRVKSPDHAKKPTELVQFNHKKHMEDYNIDCGTCHHDDKGQPLTLKIGDYVQRCDECHNRDKPVKKDAKFQGIAVGKKKPVDIMTHKNALHESCIGCHITSNKKGGDATGKKGPSPTSCRACHIPIK